MTSAGSEKKGLTEMHSRAWSLETLRELEKKVEAELAATKRHINSTPTKAPKPSPNVAPLKRSKVLQVSPLKPAQLTFAEDAEESPAHGASSTAIHSQLLADTYVEGSDVYQEIPEFGYATPEKEIPYPITDDMLCAFGSQKPVSLNPYTAEFITDRLKARSSDALSDEASTATASSEYEAKYKALQELVKSKDDQIQVLQQQLADAQAQTKIAESAAAAAAAAETAAAGIPATAPPPVVEEISSAAARQRLRRFVEKRADGTLAVPEAVHQAWKAGGKAREDLLRVWVSSNFDKTSFLREVQHQTSKSKEMRLEIVGDFYTEEELRDQMKVPKARLDEIKAFCEANPTFKRTDTYNKNKVKFWYETRTTATMEQAHRSELTDKTTMEVAPEMDADGEHVLLRDEGHAFSLTGFDVAPGGAASSSNAPGSSGDGSGKDVATSLGLPMLIGKDRPELHIAAYQNALTTRINKLTDCRGRLDAVPDKDRTEPIKKLMGKMDACIVSLDNLHDEITEMYADGAVNGFEPNGNGQKLLTVYKTATKVCPGTGLGDIGEGAMEALQLESRSKISKPKAKAEPSLPRNPKPKAKPAATKPEDAEEGSGEPKAKAKAKALRVRGKTPEK
ncbi:unnamed protein product [Symbiodinium sp. CCMP2592]|nr:unnamed protein product [Symbiodinium sp. CCMP2592]